MRAPVTYGEAATYADKAWQEAKECKHNSEVWVFCMAEHMYWVQVAVDIQSELLTKRDLNFVGVVL